MLALFTFSKTLKMTDKHSKIAFAAFFSKFLPRKNRLEIRGRQKVKQENKLKQEIKVHINLPTVKPLPVAGKLG